MNEKRLQCLETSLKALKNTYTDLTVIRDEEEKDFENIPDSLSETVFAELTVKNAEEIGSAVYDLGIVIDILQNIVNSNR